MVKLSDLKKYLDELLELHSIPNDSSNNGLQVEGKGEISNAYFGVDACQAFFKKAVDDNADFIFVHHGLSWGDNLKYLSGVTADRLRLLFTNNISLYAAHLPLDAHPDIGHNACLANMLGLNYPSMFAKYAEAEIGVKGELSSPKTAKQIAEILRKKLACNEEVKIFGDANCELRKIGVISGGSGTDGIIDATKENLDCLITGEVGHSSYHFIKETGIIVIALGHYISEKPGVLEVMQHVKKNFDIECKFVDLPTGL